MLSSPSQLPYAPVPHSYVPNTALSATINLDEVNQAVCCRAYVPQIEEF